MKFKEIIGIDISKNTFDVVIHGKKEKLLFNNKQKGFKSLLKKVDKISTVNPEQRIYILEHTGLYSYQISNFFSERNIPFMLVPGLEVKRSLGITRGKSDEIDAKKLALYGYRLRDELKATVMPEELILSIKRLSTLRTRLIKQAAGFKASLKEYKRVLKQKDNKVLIDIQKKMINCLNTKIAAIDKEIDNLIKSDPKLIMQFKLLITIKGVGSQTAINMIIYTNGFTKFATWRQFASYCGIAPFPNQSGTSIRGRTKISHLANKKLKTLLDLCAKSAIQYNSEMRMYYQKRVSEGKNKRSTINIIRNKLLSRMFAVIKRNTPYVDVYKYAA